MQSQLVSNLAKDFSAAQSAPVMLPVLSYESEC